MDMGDRMGGLHTDYIMYLFRFYKPLIVERRVNRIVRSRDGESCEHADWNTLIESFGTAMRV